MPGGVAPFAPHTSARHCIDAAYGVHISQVYEVWKQSKPAMSNPPAAYDPVEGFVQPSLGFRRCHIITSATTAVRIRTLSVN